MIQKAWKKNIAILLVVAMMLTIMPVAVFAEGGEETDDINVLSGETATPAAIQFQFNDTVVTESMNMNVGDTGTLIAIVVDEEGHAIDSLETDITLSNDEGAVLFENGQLSAEVAGKASLAASYVDTENAIDLNAALEITVLQEKILTELKESTVALIGLEEYETLQAALDAVTDDETVTLVKDITESVSAQDKSFTLDLSNHTIIGNGDSVIRLSGGVVILKNGTITGGTALKNGGGISFEGTALTLDSITVSDNHANGIGGGVYGKTSENFVIKNSYIDNNTTVKGAGGVHCLYMPVTIEDSFIQNNVSTDKIAGFGGLYIVNKSTGDIKLLNTTISENKGKQSAFSVSKAETLTLNNCTICDNEDTTAPVMQANTISGEVMFESCTIRNNTGTTLVNLNGKATFLNSKINGNISTSSANGGGIDFTGDELKLQNTVVKGNVTTSDDTRYRSAGITLRKGTLRVENSAVYNNMVSDTNQANDLFIGAGTTVEILAAKNMQDTEVAPNYFSNYVWEETLAGSIETGLNGTVDVNSCYTAKPKTEDEKVIYLDVINGNDTNDGKTSKMSIKTFETAEKILNGEKGTIFILSPIYVTEDEVWDLNGSTLYRHPNLSKSAALVTVTGTLKIKNTVLDGSAKKLGLKEQNSLIVVETDGCLELGEGSVLQNNAACTVTNQMSPKRNSGGAIENHGTVILDGGVVQECSAAFGGGIYCDQGNVVINEGRITNNKATALYWNQRKEAAGGGIMADGSGQIIMNGGQISNNSSGYFGGGVSLGSYFVGDVAKLNATFKMNGGTICDNTAVANGGGLFVQCNCAAIITKGSILSNKCCLGETDPYGGGGIYVNGGREGCTNGSLQLYNVVVADNTAETRGGGIAGCPTSRVELYLSNGGAIYGNHAPEARDIHIYNLPVSGLTAIAYISEYMLGGGAYHWKDDDGKEIAIDALHNTVSRNAHTDVTENDVSVRTANQLATVFIKGNYSGTSGGGIGTNGDVTIGTAPNETLTIGVQKKWQDSFEDDDIASIGSENPLARPESVKFYLYRQIEGGEKERVGHVNIRWDWLNGRWKENAIFSDQPKFDRDGNEYIYTVEEDMTELKDKYDVIVENDENNWTFTNIYNPKGSLEVSKKVVSNNEADKKKEFTFTVTLDDTTVNGVYGGMNFKDGVSVFKLKDGETTTASGLQIDISYKVEETDNDGYTVTKTGDTGVIEMGKTAKALFTNTKKSTPITPVDPPTTDLDPEKPTKPEEPITDPEVPTTEPTTPEEPITDPDVPTTDVPGTPVEPIAEPEVPLGDAPKTGDSSNAVPFAALALVAGAGLVIARRKIN